VLDLTEDQKLLKDTIRDFCQNEIAPHVERWDEEEHCPVEVLRKMADLGLWGMTIPEEHGGAGLDTLTYTIAVEEMSRWSAAVAIAICVHNTVGAGPILHYGTDEQKTTFLPRLATEWLGCFCLTEPSAGSDAAAMRSTARRDGDHYVLDGTKIYVTNGDVADVFIVFAKTDPTQRAKGVSAFVVPRETPGLEMGTKERKMGLRASGTMEVVLNGLRVPVANRLGAEGQGFKVAMSALDGGRIGVAAQACGVARAAFEDAVAYARQREAFGHAISHFQAIRHKLANMKVDLDAAWLLTTRAAEMRDAGRRVTLEASMAKLYASEMVQRVTSDAVQIHGGYGYMRDYPVERYYRDARVMALYEGTSEIQRHVIAREILGR
jgi:hypothetical protein